MKAAQWLAAFFLGAALSPALACDSILQLGQETRSRYREVERLDEFHRSACSGKTRRTGYAFDTAGKAFYSGLTASGHFKGSKQKDAEDVFCESYDEVRESMQRDLRYDVTTNPNVVEAWSACTRLGNEAPPFVANYDHPRFTLTVSRSSKRDTDIDFFKTTRESVACSYQLPDEPRKPVDAHFAVLRAKSDKPVTFDCINEPTSTDSKTVTFDAFKVMATINGQAVNFPIERVVATTPRYADEIALSLIPKGMVAFFATHQCPYGWASYGKAQGRYVVGLSAADGDAVEAVVGSSLALGENRPTGAHVHATRGQPKPRGGGGESFLNSKPADTGPAFYQENGVRKEAVEGTNAPYVALLACVKT